MLEGVSRQIFWWRNKEEIGDLHRVVWIYVIVFLVWSAYRILFGTLNEWFEELVLKGVVFGLPVVWVVLKIDKGSLTDLGMVMKGLLASVYFGLLYGLWLAVLGNVIVFLRDGGVGYNPDLGVAAFGNLMLLGLVTAFWEQLLFVGFMLPRVVKDLKSEWWGVTLVAIMFAAIHVPIQIAQGVEVGQIFVRFLLLFSLGFGNGIMYLRLKNLAAPIFAHLAWGSVIFLFG